MEWSFGLIPKVKALHLGRPLLFHTRCVQFKGVAMSKEEWRPVVGYEDRYEVSSLGRVRSVLRGIIMKTSLNRYGYEQLYLSKGSMASRKNCTVHRMVALSFFGESSLQVDHINENKSDNNVQNLRFVTNQENGFYSKGSRNSTGLAGVKWSKYPKGRNWASQIRKNGIKVTLGYFATPEEAHESYMKEYRDQVITERSEGGSE